MVKIFFNKKKNNFSFLYFLIFVFVSLAFVFFILTIFDTLSNPFSGEKNIKPFSNEKNTFEDINLAYQNKVNFILKDLIEKNIQISAEDYLKKSQNFKDALDSLLDLRLSEQFKADHLSLVLILANLEDAYKNKNISEIKSSENQLQKFVAEHDWVSL